METITGDIIIRAAAILGAGIAMGFGAIGPGIGEGFAAGKACEAIGQRPDEANLITRTMLIGQAVSESTGIYSLVIALILIFVV
jgi:F-type H+-transporting ATPase subunit c